MSHLLQGISKVLFMYKKNTPEPYMIDRVQFASAESGNMNPMIFYIKWPQQAVMDKTIQPGQYSPMFKELSVTPIYNRPLPPIPQEPKGFFVHWNEGTIQPTDLERVFRNNYRLRCQIIKCRAMDKEADGEFCKYNTSSINYHTDISNICDTEYGTIDHTAKDGKKKKDRKGKPVKLTCKNGKNLVWGNKIKPMVTSTPKLYSDDTKDAISPSSSNSSSSRVFHRKNSTSTLPPRSPPPPVPKGIPIPIDYDDTIFNIDTSEEAELPRQYSPEYHIDRRFDETFLVEYQGGTYIEEETIYEENEETPILYDFNKADQEPIYEVPNRILAKMNRHDSVRHEVIGLRYCSAESIAKKLTFDDVVEEEEDAYTWLRCVPEHILLKELDERRRQELNESMPFPPTSCSSSDDEEEELEQAPPVPEPFVLQTIDEIWISESVYV